MRDTAPELPERPAAPLELARLARREDGRAGRRSNDGTQDAGATPAVLAGRPRHAVEQQISAANAPRPDRIGCQAPPSREGLAVARPRIGATGERCDRRHHGVALVRRERPHFRPRFARPFHVEEHRGVVGSARRSLRYRAAVQRRSSFLGLILVAGGGLACAPATAPPPARPASATPASAAPAAPGAAPLTDDGPPAERVAVPSDGPSRGPATAKVTIVEFSDFQCPFCARVNPTLDQIRASYPDDVRIVFRHDPLPFHNNAALAAEAAVAAEWQGKFWEMHDKLFANQRDLDRAGLEARAAELGLDLPAFRQALDAHAAKARVDADLALGQKLGVHGTPTFFVDGRTVMGAQPFAEFKRVIDDELARADRLLARGVPRGRLYATFFSGPVRRCRDRGLPGAGSTVYRVPTLDAPVRGGAQPKVTIIEFGDFQCPFTGRVKPTLDALLQTYGADLALVFRHNPLSFHANAQLAAEAAEAARAQGKFWEMHDKLFANQQALGRDALTGYARELGLDVGRFNAALDGEQERRASTATSPTTPASAWAGRHVLHQRPIAPRRAADRGFQTDHRRGAPQGERAAGGRHAARRLYAALIKNGLEKEDRPAPPPAKPDPDANRRIRVDVDRRADARPRRRADHHRRVRRLPVPVLRPRRGDARAPAPRLPRRDPVRLARPAAAVSPGGATGRRRGARGGHAGEVLGDARPPLRRAARDAGARALRKGRRRAGARRRPFPRGIRRRGWQGRDRRRRAGRRQGRGQRNPHLLRQRQAPGGRAALRSLQAAGRRRAEERRGDDRQGARRARSSTPS